MCPHINQSEVLSDLREGNLECSHLFVVPPNSPQPSSSSLDCPGATFPPPRPDHLDAMRPCMLHPSSRPHSSPGQASHSHGVKPESAGRPQAPYDLALTPSSPESFPAHPSPSLSLLKCHLLTRLPLCQIQRPGSEGPGLAGPMRTATLPRQGGVSPGARGTVMWEGPRQGAGEGRGTPSGAVIQASDEANLGPGDGCWRALWPDFNRLLKIEPMGSTGGLTVSEKAWSQEGPPDIEPLEDGSSYMGHHRHREASASPLDAQGGQRVGRYGVSVWDSRRGPG